VSGAYNNNVIGFLTDSLEVKTSCGGLKKDFISQFCGNTSTKGLVLLLWGTVNQFYLPIAGITSIFPHTADSGLYNQ